MAEQHKSLAEVHESVTIPKSRSFFKTLLAFLGPAYMVSVGYMDPGNWATDIAGGSSFGYQLIWVLLMSNLMALLLQSFSARLGIVRGLDLAQASRQTYPAPVNIGLYILAEIAIAATDLAEVIGMAIGLNLLFELPMLWGVALTILDSFVLLFLMNKGIRKMEAFIIALISIIGLAFILEMLIVKPQGSEVIQGFIPSFLEDKSLYIAIGIIGATVMPHNLYLHSSLVQSRKFSREKEGIKQALKFNFIDSAIALNLAFFVNAAILILAAAAFHKQGLHQVAEIQDAHLLLQNLFGTLAPVLFAIALIAAGQSSTITGTLAGQIVMEGYLNLRIRPWVRRIITRLIAIIPAAFTILLIGEENLGELLVLSQVILSLQLGFAIIPLIHLVSDKKYMHEFYVKPAVKWLAWLVAFIIVALNIRLVIGETTPVFTSDSVPLIWKGLLGLVILAVSLLLGYVIFFPMVKRKDDTRKLPHDSIGELSHLHPKSFSKVAVALDFTGSEKTIIEYATSVGGKSIKYLLIHIVESAGARMMGNEIIDMETKADMDLLNGYSSALAKLGYQCEVFLDF
ncbi:MAG: Nramp family divalent metal transporter, partial [Bacteroidia bacterium]|nr:Nramp family divalent metal transporter [Bacteroidia bacterium]